MREGCEKRNNAGQRSLSAQGRIGRAVETGSCVPVVPLGDVYEDVVGQAGELAEKRAHQVVSGLPDCRCLWAGIA